MLRAELAARRNQKFVPVTRERFLRLIGEEVFDRRRKALIEAGSLIPDPKGTYCPGARGKGFRLSDRFTTVAQYTPRTQAFARRLVEQHPVLEGEAIPPDYRPLAEAIDSRLTIDAACAERITTETATGRTSRQRRQAAYSIASVAVGERRCSSDARGRFYSPVTGLPSAVRSTCLFGDGKPLGEIDVCNSHALILGAIVRKDVAHNTAVRRYLRLCQDGAIYDYLGETAFPDLAANVARERAKSMFQRFLNDPLRRVEEPFSAAMRRLFGPVYLFVEETHRNRCASESHLWEVLQSIEARIVLPTAVSLIDDSVFAATVHDSILVPHDHVELGAERLRESFRRIGVTPALRLPV